MPYRLNPNNEYEALIWEGDFLQDVATWLQKHDQSLGAALKWVATSYGDRHDLTITRHEHEPPITVGLGDVIVMEVATGSVEILTKAQLAARFVRVQAVD